MRNVTLLALLLAVMAGCATTKKNKTLSKVISLKIAQPGGLNGTAVAWDSATKKYYAAISGNVHFPLVVYNEFGKVQSGGSVATMFDVRGLWYNPTTNTLQTNGFKDAGLAEYQLDEQGIPVSIKKMGIASAQPNDQSVGCYDADENVVYYYDKSTTTITRQEAGGDKTVKGLFLGVKKKSAVKTSTNEEMRDRYNENVCIYTGMHKAQIGLLNVKDRQIELYNLKTGLMSLVIQIPDDVPLEPSLNFSYAHDIYWFFDRRRREWRGYRLAVLAPVPASQPK